MRTLITLAASVSAAFLAGTWYGQYSTSDTKATVPSLDQPLVSNQPAACEPSSQLRSAIVSDSAAEPIREKARQEPLNDNLYSDQPAQPHDDDTDDSLVDRYIAARNDAERDTLKEQLESRTNEERLAATELLISSDMPATRQFGYDLLSDIDTDYLTTSQIAIDASYYETDTESLVTLVETISEVCRELPNDANDHCINRLSSLSDYGEAPVELRALELLSNFDVTPATTQIFANKLFADDPDVRYAALNGFYNADQISPSTRALIQTMVDDESLDQYIRDNAKSVLNLE